MSKDPIDSFIAKAAGYLLNEYAQEKGLNMAHIATKGAIQPPVLSLIKNQKRKLTPDLGARLARSMDKSVEDFYMDLMRTALRLQEEELNQEQAVYFAGPTYLNGIKGLMDSLGEGDVYWLISIEPPIEFDTGQLDDVLLNCISQKSHINYVFPPLKYEDLIRDDVSDDDGTNSVLEEFGHVELDKHFFLWQKRFSQRYPEHKDNIHQYIHCYHAPLGGYIWFAPYVKYFLIERNGLGTSASEAWLDVAYYDPNETGVVNHSQKRCALPLNPKVVRNLRQWCVHSLREIPGISEISI